MRLNLSSQIVMDKVPEEIYRPKTAVDRSAITRFEKVQTDLFPKMEEGAKHIADVIVKEIKEKEAKGGKFVLCVGTGTSLTPIFDELISYCKEGKVSFKNVIIFNAYEYFPLEKTATNSTKEQLHTRFLDEIDVDSGNVHTLDGSIEQSNVQAMCRQYEEKIAEVGGIDLILLGIGRSGNIASNEVGSGAATTTRLILLDQMSRQALRMSAGVEKNVPPCAITVGIGTILKAQKVYIVAWGEEKADIIYKTVEGTVTEEIPSTFLQTYDGAHIIADLSAGGKLTRVVHPWLVKSCEWDDKLTRSALVWLCQLVEKPILKLTNRDYNEHGLSELLAKYGSAYDANIKIFNDLQHTITGWPGGKPNADDTYRPERAKPFPKRVIIFSPHPDDDVISMGGTFRRLVKQGHEVHVAYQTSGNFAVADEEVTKFLHFVNGFNQLFLDNKDGEISKIYRENKEFLKQKKEGDIDSLSIRTIKTLIRRGEARTACAYNGIPTKQVHFLNLPFYESGRVEKLPMSEKDVEIVRDLIVKVKPHMIFVAGDLADPHGTHRKCTDAVLAAIDLEKDQNAEWLKDCRVWMYRGAWAEWDIKDIEMCVPMSPEELRGKRNSILKHQSQDAGAPFLGNDARMFWQRAEDRNHATAQLYHDLGLASYEAMEAFVEYIPL